jgi:hypothetical protein
LPPEVGGAWPVRRLGRSSSSSRLPVAPSRRCSSSTFWPDGYVLGSQQRLRWVLSDLWRPTGRWGVERSESAVTPACPPQEKGARERLGDTSAQEVRRPICETAVRADQLAADVSPVHPRDPDPRRKRKFMQGARTSTPVASRSRLRGDRGWTRGRTTGVAIGVVTVVLVAYALF